MMMLLKLPLLLVIFASLVSQSSCQFFFSKLQFEVSESNKIKNSQDKFEISTKSTLTANSFVETVKFNLKGKHNQTDAIKVTVDNFECHQSYMKPMADSAEFAFMCEITGRHVSIVVQAREKQEILDLAVSGENVTEGFVVVVANKKSVSDYHPKSAIPFQFFIEGPRTSQSATAAGSAAAAAAAAAAANPPTFWLSFVFKQAHRVASVGLWLGSAQRNGWDSIKIYGLKSRASIDKWEKIEETVMAGIKNGDWQILGEEPILPATGVKENRKGILARLIGKKGKEEEEEEEKKRPTQLFFQQSTQVDVRQKVSPNAKEMKGLLELQSVAAEVKIPVGSHVLIYGLYLVALPT